MLVCCLVFVFLYSFLNGGGLGSSAASLQSKTWQTDFDWSSWSMDKTSLVSSYDSSKVDGGVSLSKVGSSYQTAGTAEYRFSPGGTNKWTSATYDSDNGGAQNVSRYLWVTLFNTDQVARLDPITMEILEMYNVGDEPSHTAIGCNNDVWIVNSSVSAQSVSHIYPDDSGKFLVKTLKLIDPNPNTSFSFKIRTINAHKSANGQCSLYISVGPQSYGDAWTGKFFRVNGDSFNSRTDSQGMEIQTTLELPFIVTRWSRWAGTEREFSPWGSVIDKTGNYIYLVGGLGNEEGIIQIKIKGTPYVLQTHMHETDGLKLSSDVINADAYGNIWTSNYDIDSLSKLSVFPDNNEPANYYDRNQPGNYRRVASLDARITMNYNASFGVYVPKGNSVAVIPVSKSSSASGTNIDKLVFSDGDHIGKYYISNLVRDESTGKPHRLKSEDGVQTVDVESDYFNTGVTGSGGAKCQNAPEAGQDDAALAYNDNLDLIAIPRGCDTGIRLLASNNYETAEFFSLSTAGGAYANLYNDFLKSRYDVGGSTLDLVYSNQPFSTSNPGISNVSNVPSSSDLYIKASFTGDGSLSSTLKSLAINYEGGDGAVLIKRETFSDNGYTSREGTFENNQRVYVKLTVYQPSVVSEMASITDQIVNFKSSTIKQENPLGDGRLVNASPQPDGQGSVKLEFKFSSGMKQGENIIYYSYEAAD